MNLLASFALGGFNPWAAGFGIGSLVLFGLVGLVAGPNLKNFDPDAVSYTHLTLPTIYSV